ncbi:hypothetical protein EYF80_035409 [Liparis tanakae]|uniref:Uncharacterized protein n=1 Tax=Liparis tanakae TaxID=230148 RepID=A0A4Z2GMD8_9TELE|nr:hypothetical protein EYF80_035409 [Liparis tanakae]
MTDIEGETRRFLSECPRVACHKPRFPTPEKAESNEGNRAEGVHRPRDSRPATRGSLFRVKVSSGRAAPSSPPPLIYTASSNAASRERKMFPDIPDVL